MLFFFHNIISFLFFSALKPLEDAEASMQKRVVLHRLPIRGHARGHQHGQQSVPRAQSPKTFSAGPRTGVVPPSLIRDRPMLPVHMAGSLQPVRVLANPASAQSPMHSHEHRQSLLSQNPELADLYTNGILPSWQFSRSAIVSNNSSVPAG